MFYLTPDWKKDKPTQSQLIYIGKMNKENPDIPKFTGKTKGEAAEYIEKYNKRSSRWQKH